MRVDELTTETDASGSEPNPSRANKTRRVAIEWTLIIVVAVLASFLVRTFVFQTFYIPSGSMNPTLWKGDRIIVDKLSVEFGTINIGDIVVFRAPPDVAKDCGDPVTDLVKRVIGLPGDRLYTKDNTIYVNGQPLDQKWTVWPTIGTPIPPTTVPDLIGKVFVRIWPLTSIKWF